MKKYYVVNSQEDEDGSILYPVSKITDAGKRNLQIVSFHDKTTNKEPDSVKMYFQEKFISPAQTKRMNKK